MKQIYRETKVVTNLIESKTRKFLYFEMRRSRLFRLGLVENRTKKKKSHLPGVQSIRAIILLLSDLLRAINFRSSAAANE